MAAYILMDRDDVCGRRGCRRRPLIVSPLTLSNTHTHILDLKRCLSRVSRELILNSTMYGGFAWVKRLTSQNSKGGICFMEGIS